MCNMTTMGADRRGSDLRACTNTTKMSLGKAIQTLDPHADAKSESKKATQQAKQDVNESVRNSSINWQPSGPALSRRSPVQSKKSGPFFCTTLSQEKSRTGGGQFDRGIYEPTPFTSCLACCVPFWTPDFGIRVRIQRLDGLAEAHLRRVRARRGHSPTVAPLVVYCTSRLRTHRCYSVSLAR